MVKRKQSSEGPTRRSKRLQKEGPDIWMPNQFKLSQSGLLKLPGEIRNTIWEMVLGNQTLHFNQLPHGFNLTACASHITEEKANKMAMAEHPDKMFFARDSEYSQRWAPSTNDELMDRHFNCDRAIAPIVTFDLLRVCRQIYAETATLPYSKNTWAFDQAFPFEKFLKRLTILQRQSLKSISLDVEWMDDYEPIGYFETEYRPTIGEWNEVLDPSLISKLTGVRTLNLHLSEMFEEPVSYVKAMLDGGWAAESILYFHRLPLETVNVIITVENADVDLMYDEDVDLIQTLPLCSRQKFATEIKSFLLNRDKENMSKMLDLFAKDFRKIPESWKFFRNYVHHTAFKAFSEEADN